MTDPFEAYEKKIHDLKYQIQDLTHHRYILLFALKVFAAGPESTAGTKMSNSEAVARARRTISAVEGCIARTDKKESA